MRAGSRGWAWASGRLWALLLANVVMWVIGGAFTIRENIWLLAGGILIYMALIPVAEAAETVLQKVVPYETQGRVFGLAQAVEVAAAPICAFLIGPIGQYWLIPYMNSGRRADAAGLAARRRGQARGIALVFVLASVVGLLITLVAFLTRSYRTHRALPGTAGLRPPAESAVVGADDSLSR